MKLLHNLIDRQVSTYPLALFRVIFIAVFLAETISNFFFRELLFDQVPLFSDSPLMIASLFLIWIMILISLLFGFRIVPFGIANYLLAAVVLGIGGKVYGYDWHADGLYIVSSLFLVIMPTGDYFSIDKTQQTAKKEASFFYVVIMILVIGTIYIDSILWKATSPMYLSGLGFWAPASLPFNTYFDLSILLEFEWLNRAAGYFVLLFETLFLVFIWREKWRPWLVAIGIFFHLSILLAFPIPNFSLMMVALFLAVLPLGTYEWLKIIPSAVAQQKSKPVFSIPVQMNTRFATLFLGFWIFSFVVISFKSPVYQTYISADSQLLTLAERAATRYKTLIYPWTGFSDHGVFMDQHFVDYDSQVRLVYQDSNSELPLPLISETGTASVTGYNRNRNWVVWTFRAADPSIAQAKAESTMLGYAEFWWRQQENELSGQIMILEREIDVSLSEWEPGLLEHNRSESWEKIGYISGPPSQFEVVWTQNR